MPDVGGNLHLVIRDERIKQGLSQKKLGELVELPQQAINRIEQGQRKIDIELFQKLCEALKIKKLGNFSVKFISSYYEMDEMDEKRKQSLIDMYESLNETGKEEAIKRIKELTELRKYVEPEE